MNFNIISLISKVQDVVVSDFRPIVISNFRFKVISKILADRLGIIYSRMISHNQNDFIREPHIKVCICIASEVLTCCLKLLRMVRLLSRFDISKAFNTFSLDFFTTGVASFWFSLHFYQLDPYYLAICFSFD